MKNYNWQDFIREHLTESDVTGRGGQIMVDVSEIFPDISNPVIGAYQNYLGGGIAGKIVGAAMFSPDELNESDKITFQELLGELEIFFHGLNNGGGDEYMQSLELGFADTQKLPVSAY